jgi:ribulose-5-phosphate 4-epimerase/fuculose-1-phosphate aldolase
LKFFAKLGFVTTASGHMSFRDGDSWWLNGFGVPYTKITGNELSQLDYSGNIISGHHKVNFAAKYLHSAIYKARPDVNSITHFHTDYATAWSTLGIPLKIITQEAAVFYNDIALYDNFNGLIDSNAESNEIVDALGNNNSIILQNHGSVTVGKSVESAAYRLILLEKICQLNILAASAGSPKELNPIVAQQTYDFLSTEEALTYQYHFFKDNNEPPN